MPTTWKSDRTRRDEADLDRRIFAEHRVEALSDDQHAAFKRIDGACLAAEAHALGRGGQPHEIVGAALYLASEASSYTTGAFINIDGLPR